jgi:hypothetical protein
METLKKEVQDLKLRCDAHATTIEYLQSRCDTYEQSVESYRQQLASLLNDRGVLDTNYEGDKLDLH